MATSKKTVMLDKYARDPRAWRDFANFTYDAATHLFISHNPFLIFAAATLGHHSLEMYLKAALICEGAAVFDPKKIRHLEPIVPKLHVGDCAWGHDLVVLARQLAKRRPDFDLGAQMSILVPWHQPAAVTVEQSFALFNPFFSELRYPQELTMGGVGEDDRLLLDELVERLQPFLARIK